MDCLHDELLHLMCAEHLFAAGQGAAASCIALDLPSLGECRQHSCRGGACWSKYNLNFDSVRGRGSGRLVSPLLTDPAAVQRTKSCRKPCLLSEGASRRRRNLDARGELAVHHRSNHGDFL
eukprot:591035-Hanusia_phi.AAC.2